MKPRYRTQPRVVQVAGRRIEVLTVANLDSFVDREALLRCEDPPEPPYWAHLWSGAIVLAQEVLERREVPLRWRALDLGCGLGMTGIAAGLRGAAVTFMDRVEDALAFALENARRNGLTGATAVNADFTRCQTGARYDVVLAAEVLYDRPVFGRLVEFVDRHLEPSGELLLADGHRTDTKGFYAELTRAGFEYSTRPVRVREEGLPVEIDLVSARRVARRDSEG